MTGPKIAYLMHVDWNWIKQRPHFLYEELTRFYEVDLFFIDKLWDNQTRKLQNSRNVYSDSLVYTLKKLPLSGLLSGFRCLEHLINNRVIKSLEKYQYIWITSPLLLDYISIDSFTYQTVIYDCMDNFLEFYPNRKRKTRLRELEIRLVERSNLVITSSEYLQRMMVSNYGRNLRNTPHLVNNAISSDLLLMKELNSALAIEDKMLQMELVNLVYIGTVGSWMDFDLILSVLEHIPYCKFTLVGPIDAAEIPSHPRIHIIGAVGHDQISKYAQIADALVMPFVLNELVRSVDPIKIYEYILFNKPILAIRYEEMNKFLPFVALYSNTQEFINIVLQIKEGKLESYSYSERLTFLSANTWEERCKKIVHLLNGGNHESHHPSRRHRVAPVSIDQSYK